MVEDNVLQAEDISGFGSVYDGPEGSSVFGFGLIYQSVPRFQLNEHVSHVRGATGSKTFGFDDTNAGYIIATVEFSEASFVRMIFGIVSERYAIISRPKTPWSQV
jgi:hypothetical protein